MSRRARERANARPWEAGEQPEPDDHQHAGDFPERDADALAVTDRLPDELPAHHPLMDARQSARQLLAALKKA